MRAWFAALAVVAVVIASPALAARDTAAVTGAEQPTLGQQGPMTKQAQELLRAAGLYKGPVDGRPNAALTDAILRFQGKEGLEKTGLVAPDLIHKLENAAGVRKLERQLTRSREQQTTDAKSALGQSRLITSLGATPPQRRIIGPREKAKCFDHPSAACLVGVVLGDVKEVDRVDLRDWALGDIVAISIRAGASETAYSALLQIDDPRSTLLALRSIAESEGRAGRIDAAMAAAADIPDPLRRAEAYAAIATIRLQADDRKGALETITLAAQSANKLPEPDLPLLAALGVAAARGGDVEQAHILFNAALKSGDDLEQRAVVASAMADADDPKAALAMAEPIKIATQRDGILVAVATAFSRLGDFASARATAQTIDAERYRAVTLASVAIDAAHADKTDEARAATSAAQAITDRIKLPFARSFAQNRLAIALDATGESEAGLAMAKLIRDPALRADSLWTIAAHLPEENPLHLEARHQAAIAVTAVSDPVVRTRTLCTQATDLVTRGEETRGRETLSKALGMAKSITNTWTRVRALLAVAETYADLESPARRGETTR